MNGMPAHIENGEAHIPEGDRAVDRVFERIAETYDRMNDFISLGTHRIAKRMMIKASGVRPGDRVLDLAGGSGDMSIRFGAITGGDGLVVLADRNRAMMKVAERRLTSSADCMSCVCVGADAHRLPFADGVFDCVAISFGVRNFTDIPGGLGAVRRVMKSGGTVIILDFSQPRNRVLRYAFRQYLSGVVPPAARILSGNEESYRYLAASVRAHPDQETLLGMMEGAGFHGCRCRSIMNGILALHSGRKA